MRRTSRSAASPTAAAGAASLGEPPAELVAGDVLAGPGDVVRLVDDDEIPAGVDDRLDAVGCCARRPARPSIRRAPDRLHGIERADDLVEGAPWVDAGVERDAAGADEHELLVEPVGHLRHPLELDALRRDDQDSLHEPAGLELGDDEPGFDRLAEADLVGQQQPERFGRQGPVEHGELVGQRLDAAPGDRQRLAVGHRAPSQPGGGAPDDLVRQSTCRSRERAGAHAAATRSTRPVDGTTTVATDCAPELLGGEDRDRLRRRQPTRRRSISACELLGVVEVEEQPLVLSERLGREPLAHGDDRREVAPLPRVGEARLAPPRG